MVDLVVDKIQSFEEFSKFMDKFSFDSKTIIIKPNWVSPKKGSYTEAKVLEFFFKYFEDKKLIVIEGNSAWRNEPNLKGIKKILNDSNLESTKHKRDWLKEQDEWFLEYTKIKPLLEKYNVEYINITEEVWANQVAEKELVKEKVESKYSPLKYSEFYSYFPSRLLEFEGAILISLSKIKTEYKPFGITASTKNLFGLVPDPSRWNYHGENHKFIPQAVLDINKIYRSFFDCVFLVEGIFTATANYMSDNPLLVENWGYILASRNSVLVDSYVAKMLGVDLNDIEYLPLCLEAFGGFDKNVLKEVSVKKW